MAELKSSSNAALLYAALRMLETRKEKAFLNEMIDVYTSYMSPMMEPQIRSDDDLSNHHMTSLNKLRRHYDEDHRKLLSWDKVCAEVNRKYTQITSENAVRRNEDFGELVGKCKEQYRMAMEMYVSDSVKAEIQMKEKHQREMEQSLYIFRQKAPTNDPKWETHLKNFITDAYRTCTDVNVNRLKMSENALAIYRRAMAARNQQPLTDHEIQGLHRDEQKKAIAIFLSDARVDWLPQSTPDSNFLDRKIDTEYQTIKLANSTLRDEVYSSLVDTWTGEYDNKMKASMKNILREKEFNFKHEEIFTAIKTSFTKKAPTEGPCLCNWLQTLQGKVLEKRQILFLENSRRQEEAIWTLLKQYCVEFERRMRACLVEQIPTDSDFEETKSREKGKVIKGFREKAPVYVEPLEKWLATLGSEIDRIEDNVKEEINRRRENRRRIELHSRTLEQAFQQIDREMDQDFGSHTPYIPSQTIKESGLELKKYIQTWFVAKTECDETCPSHLLREIEEHVEKKEAEYINQNSAKKTKKNISDHTEDPMTSEHQENLRKLCSLFVDNLVIDASFIACLTSHDVLPPAWIDDLSNQVLPHRERILTFLKRLEKRPDSAYEGFMKALQNSGQKHLALQLSKEETLETI